jgi:hypothetical protein
VLYSISTILERSSMRKPSLIAALLATGLVFVATAASALAAYAPTLTGSQNGAKTTIHVTSAKADDSTAAIHILSPSASTLTAAPGTTIGTVTASINARAISPDAIIPLTGNVVVADPTKYVSATDKACSGAPINTAVWNLSLTAAGQTLNVPVYVNPAPASLAALGVQTVLVTCLASPDVGAACAATLCAKLLDVNFTVNGIFTKGSSPTWISEFTPYTPGTANPNAAGTVTALGLDVKPVVTLSGKAGKGKAVLAGRISIAGVPLPGAPVTIFSGTKKVGTAKTTTAGSYVFTAKAKKGSHSYRAAIASPEVNAGTQACAAIPAGTPGLGPCVSSAIPAFAVSSKVVKVKVK